jgi:hypothetical protein
MDNIRKRYYRERRLMRYIKRRRLVRRLTEELRITIKKRLLNVINAIINKRIKLKQIYNCPFCNIPMHYTGTNPTCENYKCSACQGILAVEHYTNGDTTVPHNVI